MWKAAQVIRNVKAVEVIAIVMRRKALIELSTTYTEAIHQIRAVKGTAVLKQGELATTKARQSLYATLYPGVTEQKKVRNLFDMTSSAPHHTSTYGIIMDVTVCWP